MVARPQVSATPALDEWIAHDGESDVLAAVEDLQKAVAAGVVPVVRDEASLRAYWDGRRHQRT